MIFGIFGPSCVGKSTVSRRVAVELNMPLRSCGSVVRDRAKELEIDLGVLPDAIHREIDQETVTWALTHQPCVVEGRFLDCVLDAVRPVLVIRLTASIIQRQIRAYNTSESHISNDHLLKADQADMRFVDRMFPSFRASVACITVDTSELTVEECSLRVKAIIAARLPPLD